MFEKITYFTPAYDEPGGRGRGCVKLYMVLKGPKGAVSFMMLTNWNLPYVTVGRVAEAIRYPSHIQVENHFLPQPADLCYHSPVPLCEDAHDEFRKEHCTHLDGPCYAQGSCEGADEIYEVLLERGSEGAWEALESLYHETFEGGDK